MTISPRALSAKESVDAILSIAQLPMNEEEYERLVRLYPLLRAQVAELRFPEVRCEEPAMVYGALERQ